MYESILTSHPVPSILLLPDAPRFTIERANKAYLETCGTTAEQLAGKGIFEVLTDSEEGYLTVGESTLEKSLQEVLITKAPTKTVLKKRDLIAVAGEFEFPRWELQNTPISDARGDIRFILQTFVPIARQIGTEFSKEQTKGHLFLKNEQYASLFYHNPDAVFSLDKNGFFTSVNQRLLDLVGTDEAQLLKSTFKPFISPECIARVEAHFAMAINGDAQNYDTDIITARGQHLTVNATKLPIVVDGVIVGVFGIVKDITERKKTELLLLKKEALMNEAQRMAKMGSWNFDFHADRLTWTDALYDVFDADKEQFVETYGSFLKFVVEEDRDRVIAASKASQRTGEPFNIEYTITTFKGEKRVIEEFGYSEKDQNGKIIRLFGTAQNITERQNAFQALQTSEARYKGFYELQTNYIIRTDLAGNYTYCNKKFAADYGWLYPDGELIGKNALSSTMEYELQKVIDVIKQCISTPGLVQKLEIDKPTKTGKATTLWDFICIPDAHGIPTEIQCIGIDISDRIKYEKALIESNRRYELVSNATNDMVWDWDLATGDVYRSKTGWERIFGYKESNDYLRVDAFRKRIHPDDKSTTHTFVDRFLSDPSSLKFEHEFRVRRDDGSYAYVIDKGYLVRDEKGTPVRLIGALQDITKRKLSEIEVTLKEQRFRNLVQSSNDMISIHDVKGVNCYSSPSVKSVLGYDEDDFLGLNVLNLIHREDFARMRSELRKLRAQKFIELTPFRFPDASGQYRWLECKVTDLLEDPAVRGIVVNSRDVTQRILQEAEKEKLIEELTLNIQDLKQFSFITSHNLRAPLSNLQGILHILDVSEIKNKETLMLVDGLKKSTNQLSETINDLVNVLIIKQNTNLVKEPLSLSGTFEKVSDLLKGLLDEASPVLTTSFGAAPEVFFHRAYLDSIFLNLITNAVKYRSTDRPLQIEISSRVEDDYVVLSFSDNGLGIDIVKYGSRIFGLYQRFHTDKEGKGIGLYMIHSQITTLGGKVTVDSQVGQGTSFNLYFKREKADVK